MLYMNEELNSAFRNFYALKNHYETRNRDKRVKTCPVCKQKGGAIFTQSKNKLTAICGASKPCRFHIEIIRGMSENIRDTFNEANDEFIETRKDIIRRKLMHIYDDSDISDIDDIIEMYNGISTYRSELQNDLHDRITNRRNTGSIKEKQTELSQLLSVVSDKIAKHKEGVPGIHDIITLYNSDIVPTANAIRDLTYVTTYNYTSPEKGNPLYDPDDNVLIQKRYNETSMEIQISDPRVISNVVTK